MYKIFLNPLIILLVFKSSFAQTKFKSFHQNGNTKTVGITDDHDRKMGTWRTYNAVGTLKDIEDFKNDTLDGIIQSFYDNGQLMMTGSYIKGTISGNWCFYHANGQLNYKCTYNDGKMIGKVKYYYENGKLQSETMFGEDGWPTGKLKEYYDNGQLESVGYAQNGIVTGSWQFYYPSGHLKATGQYHNFEKIGNWQYFDEQDRKSAKIKKRLK